MLPRLVAPRPPHAAAAAGASHATATALPLLQAKAVYQERSPINALGSFNKPIAFFQVRHRQGALLAAGGGKKVHAG